MPHRPLVVIENAHVTCFSFLRDEVTGGTVGIPCAGYNSRTWYQLPRWVAGPRFVATGNPTFDFNRI